MSRRTDTIVLRFASMRGASTALWSDRIRADGLPGEIVRVSPAAHFPTSAASPRESNPGPSAESQPAKAPHSCRGRWRCATRNVSTDSLPMLAQTEARAFLRQAGTPSDSHTVAYLLSRAHEKPCLFASATMGKHLRSFHIESPAYRAVSDPAGQEGSPLGYK